MRKKSKEHTGSSEENIWYRVKFYHSADGDCPNAGKSEIIPYLTSSETQLRILVENSNGAKHFRGQNCRKCGVEARITIHT